jgi:Peptidase family S41
MRKKPAAVLCLVFLFVLSLPSFAAEAASPGLDRLAQVGRLWGTVRYLHPYLLDRDIDWDAALVAALPRVEAARSQEEYAAAVQGMLDALGDPVTRVLPPDTKPRPTPAPTVMLIDERAISQSEHTGLFFEAASGTTFIGTSTAGANGDVTGFSLPGGITVYFTGHDVRHADGRQLQRIGLTPEVEVAPTRAGLRAGKDEVLERVLRYLEERLR